MSLNNTILPEIDHEIVAENGPAGNWPVIKLKSNSFSELIDFLRDHGYEIDDHSVIFENGQWEVEVDWAME